MPRIILALAFIAAATLAAAPAPAADYGPGGMPHAGPFQYACPAGNYVVGVAGRAGDRLDHLAALCAPWADGHLGNQIVGMPFGRSMGGTPTSAVCTEGTAVSALDADVPFVGLTCVGVAPPHKPDGAKHEFGSNTPGGQHQHSACPEGQLATGIQGHAGQYVTALGLICGPAPK